MLASLVSVYPSNSSVSFWPAAQSCPILVLDAIVADEGEESVTSARQTELVEDNRLLSLGVFVVKLHVALVFLAGLLGDERGEPEVADELLVVADDLGVTHVELPLHDVGVEHELPEGLELSVLLCVLAREHVLDASARVLCRVLGVCTILEEVGDSFRVFAIGDVSGSTPLDAKGEHVGELGVCVSVELLCLLLARGAVLSDPCPRCHRR
jgi:hypothetical protein